MHLKLGLNHLLGELSKVWPQVLGWLADINIVLEPYHGGRTLEGNDCSKVLRYLSYLADIIPLEFAPFLDTMKAFKDVIDCCFGYSLDPTYN